LREEVRQAFTAIMGLGFANIGEKTPFCPLVPNITDQAGYVYPEDGLLNIHGIVPNSEINQPKQFNVHGDPARPVIKNGMATGTTVG
jgi:hypothetical protein